MNGRELPREDEVEARIDPGEFRDGQREAWNGAASGWRKWSPMIDGGTCAISARLVELAGVEAGSRVLDVAAGYGEPALTAARRAGPDGSVVATDISPEMIAYGRERAAQAGLENIEFVESAAASLDFPQGNFDAALSRWGIIFEPEAEAAAGRIRSFLTLGGRFAISSWGAPERVPMIALPMKIASEQLDVPLPPPGTPGPLSRPTPEALGGLLGTAGFAEVTVEEADVLLEWDSPEDFTTFNREIVPPLRAILAERSEEQQEDALTAITEAARASSGQAGEVTLSNLALLAVGRA
jgi:enediyne biosynthesis protein CalE5